MKGYTFVGNTQNCNLNKEALDVLSVTHPKLYAYTTNDKSLAVAQQRHNYMFRGLRTRLSLDAYDIYGKAITPRGRYSTVYVHDDDMNEYNRRYEAAMK